MTHDDDDDDEDEEDGFYYDGFRGDQQDPFDSAWRFGFSFGPDGMRIQEPPAFGHVLREMEEIFSQLGHWEGQSESGQAGMKPEPWPCTSLLLFGIVGSGLYNHILTKGPSSGQDRVLTQSGDLFHFRFSLYLPSLLGVPRAMLPPPQDRRERGERRSSGNPLRDLMLKSHDDDPQGPQARSSVEPRNDGHPSHEFPSSPFYGWTPFSKVSKRFAPTSIFPLKTFLLCQHEVLHLMFSL